MQSAVNALYCVFGVNTPNSLKTIIGAFSCAYRYVMDMRSREQEKDGRKTAQKENDNLCSLPIVKPCESAII